jgi:hypothetical protein
MTGMRKILRESKSDPYVPGSKESEHAPHCEFEEEKQC